MHACMHVHKISVARPWGESFPAQRGRDSKQLNFHHSQCPKSMFFYMLSQKPPN